MPDNKSFLPDQKDVVKVLNIPPAPAPAGGAATPAFRILRTNLLDPYEKPIPKAEIEASPLTAAAAGDDFAGTDRKAAKISISDAYMEPFDDLSDLVKSLTSDAKMVKLKIPLGPDSDRVQEEERNVHVDVWLYAASRENDNDFHTILGRDPDTTPRLFMNAEVSGLPPGGDARQTLKDVRDALEAIVQQTPGLGYDFYDPPIPITVEGSLFFDATHAKGGKPGPAKVKPKSIWEIHPVTTLEAR